MNTVCFKRIISGFLMVLLIIFWGVATSAKTSRESDPSGGQITNPSTKTPNDNVDDSQVRIFSSLVDGIEIQSPIGDEFAQVYHRHKAEIHQIVNKNPFLVWETVDLIVEVLPALRAVRQGDGKLYVDKRTFSKAESLFARCEALASSGLANDLRRARTQVDSRITEWDSERILVDLSK